MVAATVASRFGKAEIERMIPHAGSMVLLDNVEAWSADHIVCTAHSHASATNPLRRAEMLSSVMAIEYAAQAVAVHGGLCRNLACGEAAMADAAESENSSAARRGYLAVLSEVEWRQPRIDSITAALQVRATRLAVLSAATEYAFEICAAGDTLVTGRLMIAMEPPQAVAGAGDQALLQLNR